MKQQEVIPAGNEWVDKKILEFSASPFQRINLDWMLITAGNLESDRRNWNTMTASWGCFGELWAKDVAFIFIRPSRHTYNFAENSRLFTLSFFDENYRSALKLCGEKSGRDIDKAAAAGLTPVFFEGGVCGGAVSFREARDILVCRKMYARNFDPAFFLDPDSIEKHYNGDDYHKMYIGEILRYKTRQK
jgi:flavin reductase (DIM6/NTAB) family NADH-FMN oxidoreductase RutF